MIERGSTVMCIIEGQVVAEIRLPGASFLDYVVQDRAGRIYILSGRSVTEIVEDN